jgi:hypothetical protein
MHMALCGVRSFDYSGQNVDRPVRFAMSRSAFPKKDVAFRPPAPKCSSALGKVECCAGGGISGLDIAPVDPTAAFLGALVDFDEEPAGKQGRLGGGHGGSPGCFISGRDPGRFQEPNRLAATAARIRVTAGPTKMRLQARSPLARRSQMLRRQLRMTATMAKSAAMMVRVPEGL